jgi:septal ring factor EnvC (AmiA/AmiB activator)
LQKIAKITAFAVIAVLAILASAGTARRYPKRHSAKIPPKTEKQRTDTEKELGRLKQEIAKYQAELQEHEKLEVRSKKNIRAFERRQNELRSTIARLQAEVADLEAEKEEVDESLHQTASTLDALKSAYARSSRYLYMHGTLEAQDADLYLFAPNAQSEASRMSYYAHAIGEAHAMDRARLDSMKHSLGASSLELAHSLTQEQQQIGQSSREATSVETKKAEEARQLSQIQARKERLRALLKERMASEKRLEKIIDNLVAKEGAASRAERNTKKHTRKNGPNLGNDEAEPGRAYGPHSLQWPTASHHVAQAFGEHRNAELNTVTMNLGIDIAAPQGSPINAAAEGEVSLVASLPSYGTIVVLKHSGGLHTVYADLTGASVKQGAHVRAGQPLGRSGSNEEIGAVLHFEVWKGKAKQNPMGWLK